MVGKRGALADFEVLGIKKPVNMSTSVVMAYLYH